MNINDMLLSNGFYISDNSVEEVYTIYTKKLSKTMDLKATIIEHKKGYYLSILLSKTILFHSYIKHSDSDIFMEVFNKKVCRSLAFLSIVLLETVDLV